MQYTMSELRGMSGGLEPPSYRDNPHAIYPVESTTSLYILSAWCVTTNLKAMLTDGFCFPFLFVPQTTLHIGSLCFMADCLLPHLLIAGWLLTIYSTALV